MRGRWLSPTEALQMLYICLTVSDNKEECVLKCLDSCPSFKVGRNKYKIPHSWAVQALGDKYISLIQIINRNRHRFRQLHVELRAQSLVFFKKLK